MDLKKHGVFLMSEGMRARELADSVQRIERLGYGAVWFPEAIGREPMVTASFVLANTTSLIAATGIVNIYSRDPMATAMGQQTLAEQSGGRFLLGLGVSHSVLVNMRGHDYTKPMAAMRAYVAGVKACHKSIGILSSMLVEGIVDQPLGRGARGALTAAVGELPIVLAALGPKMTALSGQVAQGSHPANTTPEHTAQARAILGAGPWLAPIQRVCLTQDASVARAVGRQLIGFYLDLPNYRNLWMGLGFTAADMANGGSDRLVDAMLAWGDEKTIRARVQAHLDAGADHVPIVPVDPANPTQLCWRALEALTV
jgi:probable F420-dependent oxidoreductase